MLDLSRALAMHAVSHLSAGGYALIGSQEHTCLWTDTLKDPYWAVTIQTFDNCYKEPSAVKATATKISCIIAL